MNILAASEPSLVPYVLTILLVGLESPVNTGQIFTNLQSCETAVLAMRNYDKTSRYQCLPAPGISCSNSSKIKCKQD